jgi:hypothetical protein
MRIYKEGAAWVLIIKYIRTSNHIVINIFFKWKIKKESELNILVEKKINKKYKYSMNI